MQDSEGLFGGSLCRWKDWLACGTLRCGFRISKA